MALQTKRVATIAFPFFDMKSSKHASVATDRDPRYTVCIEWLHLHAIKVFEGVEACPTAQTQDGKG